MAIKNQFTEVDYWRTIGEIQALLMKYGATHVNLKNSGKGPDAIVFTMELDSRPINFLLDCDIEGIKAALKEAKYGKLDGAKDPNEKALRVGWRIVKDWIGAQMAFIEARRAKDQTRSLITAFLPYAVDLHGKTLADKLLNPADDGYKLLTNG